MSEIVKKYTNGEVTIVWKPGMCIHSTICWKGATGLHDVFDPRIKPWINPEGASTERIIEQVKKCPSGALSYYMNADGPTSSATGDHEARFDIENIIEVTPNGPLMVHGDIIVKDRDGNETKKSKVTAFCRCGHSSNKPYCDGTHTQIGFNDHR